MNLREQCDQFNVRLEPIAIETGYSLPYVGMVVRGKRQNPMILSAVMIAINLRKEKLRQMLT